MTATTRIVTGHFEHADGSDWAGGTLAYQLMSWSYLSGSVMPSDTITDTADEDGDSATTLWTNTEGQTPTVYTVTLPDGSQAEFILPPGETPISLPELFDLYQALTEWYTGDLDALFDARDAAIYAAFANTSDTALGDFLVGFRQALTGAVGRTVHAKLGDTYHVADWGVTTTATPVLLSTVFDTLEEAQAMYPATTAETFETQTVYYANDVGVQAAIDALADAGGETLNWGGGDYHFSRRFETKHKVRHQGNGTVWDFDSAPDSAYDEDGVLISSGFVASGDVDFASCVAAIGDDPVLLPAVAERLDEEDDPVTLDIELNALTIEFAEPVPAEVVPGSILLIYNDSDYSLTQHRPQYRAGEAVVVESVGSLIEDADDRLVVNLAKATYAGYAAADVDVYLMTPIEVDIRDITIKCKTEPTRLVDDVVTQVTSPIGLYIKYGSGTLSRVSLSGTNWSHIGLQTCFDFELDAITIDYYSVAIGLNYGISLWNSQRIEVKGGNCRVARHALNFGGSGEIGIPYRDIVVTGGIWDGAGEGSLGCIGMHGNGGHVQFNGCKILNSIAAAGGDITMDGCTVRSGPSGILIYAAEMVNANYTIRNCTLHVMSTLLSANDAVVGAINLVYQPDCVGGLTVLENIRIDMGGYSGYPIRLFHNGCEGHVDITKRGIDVVNMHPTANTVHFLFTGIAGAIYRRFELDNINLDRAEIRFDGTGAALIRLNNVRSYDAPTIPVYITPNPTDDPAKLIEVEVAGTFTTLRHEADPETGEIEPDQEQFTLSNIGDALYLSYPEQFHSMTMDFLTNFNSAAATLTWQYPTAEGTWDGTKWSEGTWADLSGVTNTTIITGVPFAQDGTVAWTMPTGWIKRRVGTNRRGASRLYYVRAVTSAPLTLTRLRQAVMFLDTPVTEELIEVTGCHLRGAQSTGLQIEGTSATFTQVRIAHNNLTNNGANPEGSSSAKASLYIINAKTLTLHNNRVFEAVPS